MKKICSSLLMLCFVAPFLYAQDAPASYTTTSPDGKLEVTLVANPNKLTYSIRKSGKLVLQDSKLGLLRDDGDFSKALTLGPVTRGRVIQTYELLTIKRRHNQYTATKTVFHFRNADGKPMDIIFQVSNDGVAFRYFFPDASAEPKKITAELTSFHFDTKTKGWLQPLAEAKSGWARTNPSYEEYYKKDIPVGTPSPIKAGWVYPALFKTDNNWVLLTETFPVNGDYCATHLNPESPGGEYTIGFADKSEVYTDGIAGPEYQLPWYTPWRIIAIGSLKTITESTLGTDLAASAVKTDPTIIKPGIASWSWVLLKDGQTTYPVQKQFIDYAADMHWRYCLIDAQWDTQIGYDKIKELADYARTKNVGVILWYNSGGTWNDAPQTPRNKMLTHESRVKEFSLLRDMGIKGVKIDFFGGDGQSMMKYYIDILNDAKEYGILVNFHGTTLPRGLERTYPNLVTMEAIRGMEFATFEQKNLDEQPTHCTTIPFTRNVFDPMDYTPMVLYKVPKLERRTTSAFELALPVVFQSGIQHIAETPEGMSHVPDYVKSYLQQLPNYWDDTRFVDGFPGKLVVLARRSGNKWFVAGINGEKANKTLDLDLSFINGYSAGELITDGDQPLTFTQAKLNASKHTQVKVKPNGGFVLMFEK